MAKKSKQKKEMKNVGHYSFIAGIILAVVVALIPQLTETPEASAVITWSFIILGIIVGLLNITTKETTKFLMASLVLLISTSVTSWSVRGIARIGGLLENIWSNIILFVAFAAIVVALKTVYSLAED